MQAGNIHPYLREPKVLILAGPHSEVARCYSMLTQALEDETSIGFWNR